MLRFRFWLGLLALGYIETAWPIVEITNIENRHELEVTRLVIEFTDTFRYQISYLTNPVRLVIDLPGVSLETALPMEESLGSILSGVRADQHRQGTLRLVLDLWSPTESRIFSTKTIGDLKHLLVIELRREPYIIVIDPGHGGKDPGAVGYRGIREKDVVLSIAQRLAQIIDQEPGMRSILTRERDYYPSLRRRVDIARQASAKIFVSIHVDAFKRASAHGLSLYTLSESGASDEISAYLAKRENATDLAGGVSLSEQNDSVAEAMLDMQIDWKIEESNFLGKQVLKELKGIAILHNSQVAHAGFVVLKAPAIPSILVEAGFLTNSIDATRLLKASYQQRLAAAIFRGIISYCHKRPECPLPKITRKIHVVKSGDSLFKIATNYRSKVSTIQRWNGLTSDLIYAQQRLIIPTKVP